MASGILAFEEGVGIIAVCGKLMAQILDGAIAAVIEIGRKELQNMGPVKEVFDAALNKAHFKIPQITVLSNYTGLPFMEDNVRAKGKIPGGAVNLQ